MKTETVPFDAAQYLTDEVARAQFLADAIESGNLAVIAAAMDIIARSRRLAADA